MRIQNNITAMNTHRMYTINNDNVAASAKKLSSGYRINSAADDAAGLAISEKMRSQIRGLNMATKNSQDAISLVQTAEGALQETQNMLQRMNELAVQAATGTNEDLDRTALSKEFEQLKREINDIAEQTTFNNMKVLDGSLSYAGYVRSAATAGVTTTVEEVSSANALNPVSKLDPVDGTEGAAATDAKDASVTVGGLGSILGLTATLPAGSSYVFNVGGKDFTIDSNDTLGAQKTLGDALEAKIKADGDFANSEVAVGSDSISVKGDKATPEIKVTLKTAEGAAVTGAAETVNTDKHSYKGWTADLSATFGKGDPTADANTNKKTNVNGVEYKLEIDVDGTKKTVTVKGDGSDKNIGELFANQKVTFNDVEYTLSWDNTSGKIALFDPTGGATAPATVKFKALEVNNGLDLKSETVYKAAEAAKPAQNATAGSQSYTVKLATDIGEKPTEPKKPADGASADEIAQYQQALGKYQMDLEAYEKAEAANKLALQDGGQVKFGDTTYTYKPNASGDEVGANDFTSLDDLAAKLQANSGGKFTAAASGDTLTLTQVQVPGADGTTTPSPDATFYDIEDTLEFVPAKTGEGTRTTIELDFAKMQPGDEVSFKVNGTEYSIEKKAGETRQQFMDRVAAQFGKTNEEGVSGVRVSGNALIVENQAVTDVKLTKDGLAGENTNAVRIQVGALENEQLAVSIDSMNTAGLGLDSSHLTDLENLFKGDDQDAAGAAITAVRNAINKVSDQRATLGAMQNRLDHKIANLKVSSENLSAAESRIRDVDMASEMTNFTKNNILSQAATAMLAQANSLPQNVLSLLG